MDVSPLARSRRDLLRIWLPAVCLLTLLIGGMGVVLARSQDQARADLEQRYQLRTALASHFVASYVSDIQRRERIDASRFLTDLVVAPGRFQLIASALGFDSAVLLDAGGRVLNVLPAKRALIGTRLDTTYPHLARAVSGHAAVSNVVPSAARSVPIVEVAVPFASGYGRRVFSGGAQLDHSALVAFLADSLPYAGARVYLVDAKGFVMVAGGSHDPALAAPPDVRGASGTIRIAADEYRFAWARVAGTPWNLLAVAPSAQLFAPLSGWQHWVPWAVMLAFALAAVASLVMLRRLMRQRSALAHLATHDPLTGALNRRTIERDFGRLAAMALRSGSNVGVLAIDLDGFKSVNDLHGHAVGDELLRRVAETLWLTVRPSDVVARVGGDEFVVLLADVEEVQACEIAERVQSALLEAAFAVVDGTLITPRCSVGVAVAAAGDTIDSALAGADRAMYRVKAAGHRAMHATHRA